MKSSSLIAFTIPLVYAMLSSLLIAVAIRHRQGHRWFLSLFFVSLFTFVSFFLLAPLNPKANRVKMIQMRHFRKQTILPATSD